MRNTICVRIGVLLISESKRNWQRRLGASSPLCRQRKGSWRGSEIRLGIVSSPCVTLSERMSPDSSLPDFCVLCQLNLLQSCRTAWDGLQLIQLNPALIPQVPFGQRREAAPAGSSCSAWQAQRVRQSDHHPWSTLSSAWGRGEHCRGKSCSQGRQAAPGPRNKCRGMSPDDTISTFSELWFGFCVQTCLSQPQTGAGVLLGLPGSTFLWELSSGQFCFAAGMLAVNAGFYWKRIWQIPSRFAPRVEYFECIWGEMICGKAEDEWKAPCVSPNPKFCDE